MDSEDRIAEGAIKGGDISNVYINNHVEQLDSDDGELGERIVGWILTVMVCAIVFAAPVALAAKITWIAGRWAWELI